MASAHGRSSSFVGYFNFVLEEGERGQILRTSGRENASLAPPSWFPPNPTWVHLPGSLYLDSSSFFSSNWGVRKLGSREEQDWRGADSGRSTWPAAKHGRQLDIRPPFKPVSWASVFPRPCILFNLFERNSNCIFTAVSCIFICDLWNVKRKCRDHTGSSVSPAPALELTTLRLFGNVT